MSKNAGKSSSNTQSRQEANEAFLKTSFLYGGNADYIDALYDQYRKDPSSVDAGWADFFATLDDAAADVEKNASGPSWTQEAWPPKANGEIVAGFDGQYSANGAAANVDGEIDLAQLAQRMLSASQASQQGSMATGDIIQATRDTIRAIQLIRAYRMRGHFHADLDPLGIEGEKEDKELALEHYGFSQADMDRRIFVDGYLGLEFATLREILEILQRTYCTTIGVEFMHIADPVAKSWLQRRIEGPDKKVQFTEMGRKAILQKLIEAEGFEKFLNKKYTGTKRFGLDGGESLVPALEQIIKRGGALGVSDIVLGMAHRGRLNVLSQVMGKPHRAIFHEFAGGKSTPGEVEGSGDVKYHLGASSDRAFDNNKVHLSLTANPSHLEIVDPVVLGKARAKQDQRSAVNNQFVRPRAVDRTKVLPLLIHGDAAFAGQGVVAECLGLSGLKGHRTGGSIHFIVNNQIGFTTSPHFSRSSPYPTDVAKMIDAPVFHVNGDDPEAVVHVAKIATEYRQEFGRPVVVDMFCYRRFGHNEGDEPSFTQPLMYKKIRAHETTLEIYSRKLVEEGVVTEVEIDQMKADFDAHLETEFAAGGGYEPTSADWLDGVWKGLRVADKNDARRGTTGVDETLLKEVGEKLTEVPEEIKVHKTIKRFMTNRAKMIDTGENIDWATAEALAFGTLLRDGMHVRLSGQDCERGTFSQRHSVLYDQEDESVYRPLNHLATKQGRYEVINSMLSEEAVLGFEYGYSLAEPNSLTIWEAQFGDFVNGAQVVIDQFISSGELKWLRMSGLVMLLPHGYEGQGPEHSSARLERFLQNCAEDNMQVANCTTPSNYFHILRRQLMREIRKPLILMTPKSLLRHKRCVSRLDELAEGTTFHRVLWDDADPQDPKTEISLVDDDKIRRVILCTGKVYYDLLEEREKRKIDDVYLLRVEQLYPFPEKALGEELSRFKNAEIAWCQEEPRNMGAWFFMAPLVDELLADIKHSSERLFYIGRAASASTATGNMSQHLAQLNAFLDEAFKSA